MYLPFDPAVLLLGIYLTDTSAHIKMIYGYLKFFTIALFVKVKDGNNPGIYQQRSGQLNYGICTHGILGSWKKQRESMRCTNRERSPGNIVKVKAQCAEQGKWYVTFYINWGNNTSN